MTSNTDKAMELAENFPTHRLALLEHLETMQRDCRTCSHIINFGDMTGGSTCIQSNCANHDKWKPMLEFKQMTRSE